MAYTVVVFETQEVKEEETAGVVQSIREKKIFEQTVQSLYLPAVIKAINGIGRRERKKK